LDSDVNGKIIGVRTTLVDVTRQKRVEEALVESEDKIEQDEKITFAESRGRFK